MTAFKIFFHPKAANSLKKLDRRTKEIIKNKIKELEKHPKRGKHLRYGPFWTLRIGDYRAIYEIKRDKNQVVVLFVGHRKDVYDDFSKLF